MTTTAAAVPVGGRREDVRGALLACPQLHGLSPAALDALAGAAWVRHYAAGDTVFRTGETCESMFVLLRGAVVSRTCSSDGDVVDVGVAAAGQAFGYFEVLRPSPRTEDAVALRDATVLVLPSPVALRALRTSPDTLFALLGDLVRIVRLQNRAVVERVFHPVTHRVATLLLELEHRDDRIDLGGPQVLLAQRLGVARQTLNTALRSLAARGLLVVHPGGRTLTVDRAALAAYASDR
ncbi:Crp/Fnr family transcriptional regulator [Actinomycetospora sp. NBC_00405]|uniref:Crp/Fnr family transcriptional regulator n=1 Tax=Actinomycetospora sp. NBC_00405 TaxID=2975952 RepID=UPI002E1DCCA6